MDSASGATPTHATDVLVGEAGLVVREMPAPERHRCSMVVDPGPARRRPGQNLPGGYREGMANSYFHGDLGRNVGAMRALDERLDEIARTHAGRPQPEVLAALERAVSDLGGQPHTPGLAERAQRISDGNHKEP